MQGYQDLSLAQVLRVLFDGLGWRDSAPVGITADLVGARVPRILLAVFGGGALAIAGTVMQAVFRNPLASPEILGTANGAALGATAAIALGWVAAATLALPLSAMAGALVVTIAVYGIAGGSRGFSVSSLLLAGIAMNTLVGALIAVAISNMSDDWGQATQILFWLMGNLDSTSLTDACVVGGALLVFGSGLLPFLRELDLMTLRDEGAQTLGVNVVVSRSILLAIACCLTAVTVAFTGGIAFIGLVVPHMARLVVGPVHRTLVPCAAVLGSLMFLGSDYICRVLVPGSGLRVGVVMSIIGAPFFLHLLFRLRRGQRL
jgi:iron complex transport system permease protein